MRTITSVKLSPISKSYQSAGITNTYQLIGKYLSLKASGVKHHQDAMYVWLKSIGVNSGRNNIILALAEKCDVFMHDLYDSRIYA